MIWWVIFPVLPQCQDLRFNARVPVSQLVGVGRAPNSDSSAVSSYAVTGSLFTGTDGDGTWHMVQSRDENEQEAKQEHDCVRFEVFTAVAMKDGVFWDVTPCGSCKNRRFGGT
jgi:hypothetical protein